MTYCNKMDRLVGIAAWCVACLAGLAGSSVGPNAAIAAFFASYALFVSGYIVGASNGKWRTTE